MAAAVPNKPYGLRLLGVHEAGHNIGGARAGALWVAIAESLGSACGRADGDGPNKVAAHL